MGPILTTATTAPMAVKLGIRNLLPIARDTSAGNNEAMKIFRAGPEQAAIAGQLLYDFNSEFEATGPGTAEFTRRFTQLLERDDILVLLAGSPDDPVGFAFLTLRPTPYFDGPLAQLEELYVRPGLRGSGIGSALLQEIDTRVGEVGCEEIHINVDEVDHDTRRFYERHGFSNIQPGEDYRMLCYLREL